MMVQIFPAAHGELTPEQIFPATCARDHAGTDVHTATHGGTTPGQTDVPAENAAHKGLRQEEIFQNDCSPWRSLAGAQQR